MLSSYFMFRVLRLAVGGSSPFFIRTKKGRLCVNRPVLCLGVSEKSKISSISTNTAGFCVKKPWNPQRIPAALCLKFALCLRNIRHFLCFQIHLITLIPNMGIPLPRTEGTVRGNGTATFGLQMLPPFVLTASNRSQNQCGTKSGCSP